MKKIKINPLPAMINKLKKINAEPMKIIYGFAFGIFISTTPFIGFKWLVAMPVVLLAKWSRMAFMIGLLQVNYLTGPLFYALAYFVGKSVCGYSGTFELPHRMSFGAVKDLFFGHAEIFVSLLIGGLILSIPLTAGAYYLGRSIFSRQLKTQMS